MNFLAMVYVAFLMAATVMAYKIVDIWGIYEPGSTIIYTFTFFLGNIYTEIYGPDNANKLIWESIVTGFIFAGLICMVSALPSPVNWNHTIEFNQVLGHVFRFTCAGVVGYLLSSKLNNYMLNKLKYRLKGKFFWARSLCATSISEFLATFIAGLITFFGMMPTKVIFIVMTNAFLFKIIYGLVAVWPASLIVHILKLKEEWIPNKNQELEEISRLKESG